MTVAASEITNF